MTHSPKRLQMQGIWPYTSPDGIRASCSGVSCEANRRPTFIGRFSTGACASPDLPVNSRFKRASNCGHTGTASHLSRVCFWSDWPVFNLNGVRQMASCRSWRPGAHRARSCSWVLHLLPLSLAYDLQPESPPPHKRRAHVQLAYGAVHLDAHRSIASAIRKRQDLTLRSQIRSVYRLEMAVRNLRAVNARRARALCLTERFLVSAVVLSTLALVIGQLASLIRIGAGTNPLLQSSSSTTPQVRPPATLKGFSHSEPASPAPRSPNDGAWHRFQRATSSDHRWE